MQGGPLMHTIAAKATCFEIAASAPFHEYQTQVRANADALADGLMSGGLDVLTGGTDTHLLQIDLRASTWTGKDAQEQLENVGITTNRNTVPFDERPPMVASGIRMGTPAVTMRGFDEEDIHEVARLIVESLGDRPNLNGIRARVGELCRKRPLYPGFRGWPSYQA
jgi:glycine hydroxymethyltransferase